MSSASSHNPKDSTESCHDSRTLAAAQVPSASPQRLRPARPPSSTMAEQGPAAAAAAEPPPAAAAAAAPASPGNAAEAANADARAVSEAFATREAAGLPSDYKAWSKILLLDAGYGSVKLAIGLSMRGVNEIVGVKPASSIVTFCKKIKRTADDARIARTPLALAIDSSHAVVLASGALERVLARLGLGPTCWPGPAR